MFADNMRGFGQGPWEESDIEKYFRDNMRVVHVRPEVKTLSIPWRLTEITHGRGREPFLRRQLRLCSTETTQTNSH